MGLTKDLIYLSSYFFLLSTVLQAQDAFVYYYQQQNQSQIKQEESQHRISYLIVIGIFAFINLATLFIAPFINIPIKKMVLVSCAILLLKYVCQLLYTIDFMKSFVAIVSDFADIIGTSLFYLSTLFLVQAIIQKNSCSNKSSFCYGLIIGVFTLSITLGYIVGYLCYQNTPVWLFLIILTSLTVLAAVLAYFTLMFQSPQPTLELNQEQTQNNQQQQPRPPVSQDFFKNGMTFMDIFNAMKKVYSSIFPIIPLQLSFGNIIAYTFQLLKYLQRSDEDKPVQQGLKNTMAIVIAYSLGAFLGSLITGILSDRFRIKLIGFGLIIGTTFTLLFLFAAIFAQNFVLTLIFYSFLGISSFALLTWLLSVCSKIFGGLKQVIAANVQVIFLSINIYYLIVILFQGKTDESIKFYLGLGFIIVTFVFAYFPFKRLSDILVVIQFEQANQEQTNTVDTSRNQQKQTVEMSQLEKRVEKALEQKESNDPQGLL